MKNKELSISIKKYIAVTILTALSILRMLCTSICYAEDKPPKYMENLASDFNDGLPDLFTTMSTTRKLAWRPNSDVSGTYYYHNGTPALTVNLAAWEYGPIKIAVEPDTVYYIDMDIAANESGTMYVYYAASWNSSTNKPETQGMYIAGNYTDGIFDRSIINSAEAKTWYNINGYFRTASEQTEMYIAVRDGANKVRFFTVENMKLYALPKYNEQAITEPDQDISVQGEYYQRIYLDKNSAYEISADITVKEGMESDTFGLYISSAGNTPEGICETINIDGGETKTVTGYYIIPDSLNSLGDSNENGLYRKERDIVIKSQKSDTEFSVNRLSAKLIGPPSLLESESGVLKNDSFKTQVCVGFDQKLDKATVETVANYSVSGETIEKAELNEDMTKVILTFGRMLDENDYLLNISHIKSAVGKINSDIIYGFSVKSDIIVSEPLLYYDFGVSGEKTASKLEAGKTLTAVMSMAQSTYSVEKTYTLVLAVYKDKAPVMFDFKQKALTNGASVEPLCASVTLPDNLDDGEYTAKSFIIGSVAVPSPLFNGLVSITEE